MLELSVVPNTTALGGRNLVTRVVAYNFHEIGVLQQQWCSHKVLALSYTDLFQINSLEEAICKATSQSFGTLGEMHTGFMFHIIPLQTIPNQISSLIMMMQSVSSLIHSTNKDMAGLIVQTSIKLCFNSWSSNRGSNLLIYCEIYCLCSLRSVQITISFCNTANTARVDLTVSQTLCSPTKNKMGLALFFRFDGHVTKGRRCRR